MAYSQVNSKGETYYLHQFNSPLKGGRVYQNYFFGKSINPKGTPINEVPEGRIVVENARTGLLVLKRAQLEAVAEIKTIDSTTLSAVAA